MKKALLSVSALLVLGLLLGQGCPSGNSNSAGDQSRSLVVALGPEQTVEPGSRVTITGSVSNVPEGVLFNTSLGIVKRNGQSSDTIDGTFVIEYGESTYGGYIGMQPFEWPFYINLENNAFGTYTFRFYYSADNSYETYADCTITVNGSSSGAQLFVDAGSSQTAEPGEQIKLSGSISGGTSPYTKSWSLLSKPSGAPSVTIQSPTWTTTYVQFPANAVEGDYVFRFYVTDAAGKTGSDTVKVTVSVDESNDDDLTDSFRNLLNSSTSTDLASNSYLYAKAIASIYDQNPSESRDKVADLLASQINSANDVKLLYNAEHALSGLYYPGMQNTASVNKNAKTLQAVSTAQKLVRVIYVNGVNTRSHDAMLDMKDIESILVSGSNPITQIPANEVHLVYNISATQVEGDFFGFNVCPLSNPYNTDDPFDANIRDKFSSQVAASDSVIGDLCDDGFKMDMYEAFVEKVMESENDIHLGLDAKKVADKIKESLDAGWHVVLVGHSQGNFKIEFALDWLWNNYDQCLLKDRTGVVAFGCPATYAQTINRGIKVKKIAIRYPQSTSIDIYDDDVFMKLPWSQIISMKIGDDMVSLLDSSGSSADYLWVYPDGVTYFPNNHAVKHYIARAGADIKIYVREIINGMGAGCNEQNSAPQIYYQTITGSLTQGQTGTVYVSCTATDSDGSVQTVTANLSTIGGSSTQALTKGSGNQWSWSGSVTPPESGTKTVSLTAKDDKGASNPTIATATINVSPGGVPDGSYNWYPLGSGLYKVIDLSIYNNELIAGGSMSTYNYIARWNGNEWQSIGDGFVASGCGSLDVYNGELVATGHKQNLWSSNYVAHWNGTSWQYYNWTYGYGTDITVYNNKLIVAVLGYCTSPTCTSRIYAFNGINWEIIGEANDRILCIYVYNNELIAGGDYNVINGISVNNIARWDGTTWHAMGSELQYGAVYKLTTYNGALIAAGHFATTSGQFDTQYLAASWNGNSWKYVGGKSHGFAKTITVYNSEIVVGGVFETIDGINLNNVARWNGTSWQPMGVGMNDEVGSMIIYNGELIAAGEFTYAGGNIALGIAKWSNSQ